MRAVTLIPGQGLDVSGVVLLESHAVFAILQTVRRNFGGARNAIKR